MHDLIALTLLLTSKNKSCKIHLSGESAQVYVVLFTISNQVRGVDLLAIRLIIGILWKLVTSLISRLLVACLPISHNWAPKRTAQLDTLLVGNRNDSILADCLFIKMSITSTRINSNNIYLEN